MSSTLDRGSRVKVMFLTQTGPVLGLAEMLPPISRTQQPFRFVSLEESAQRRLRATVQSHLDPGGQDAWIEKYRTAIANQPRPRRRLFRVAFGALTIATLGLGSAIYLLHAYLPK